MPLLNVTAAEAAHLAAGEVDAAVREKAARVAAPPVHRPLRGQTNIFDQLEQHGS